MERQHRPIDKEFEEADYTGVLTITGRNLRHFPNFTDDFCDPVEVFETGMDYGDACVLTVYMRWTYRYRPISLTEQLPIEIC